MLRPISEVRFLAIQDGEIKGCYGSPGGLLLCKDVDFRSPFKVAIGCTNEHGEREVVGIAAEVKPWAGCIAWRITSKVDGYKRLVGVTGYPECVIARRMTAYDEAGYYADLVNLPEPILIEPVEAHDPIYSERLEKTLAQK